MELEGAKNKLQNWRCNTQSLRMMVFLIARCFDYFVPPLHETRSHEARQYPLLLPGTLDQIWIPSV